MKDVQIKNIVGRAGRMTQHFSGNVFLVEPDIWEFDDYFDGEEEENKIPGYQEAINTRCFDIIGILNGSSDLDPDSFDLYSIANKLLKDFQRGILDEVLNSDLIELSISQKELLLSAVKDAYERINIPVFILESNPTIGYIQQNKLFAFLQSIDNIEEWLVPHPLSKDLHEKLNMIFSMLSEFGLYKPTQDYSISQVCLIARKWIGSNLLSEIISDQIAWDVKMSDENQKKAPKVNSSVRKVIKAINDDVRFRMSNSLKCYIGILDLVLASRQLELTNVKLNYYLEIGSSIEEVISLINIGLSRESSLEVYGAVSGFEGIENKNELKALVDSGKLNTMHNVALQEIKNLLD